MRPAYLFHMHLLGAFLFVLIVLLPNSEVLGFLRVSYSDSIVVERSELIAVAHLKKDSIVYVPGTASSDDGVSWEHRATLVITEVLKGKAPGNEIPIVIHYGLGPFVGGDFKTEGSVSRHRSVKKGLPKDVVQIYDTGNSEQPSDALVDDVCADNIWFLRRLGGRLGREIGAGDFGIVDPEDLQPLALKEYFLAYLSPDPEAAVRKQVQTNPAVATRGDIYLGTCEFKRIEKITDPRERCERLLSFCEANPDWWPSVTSKRGLISCGKVAGPYLEALYDSPKYPSMRQDIMRAWGQIGYQEAVPILIHVLEENEKFWAAQKLEKGWWNRDDDSARRETRRDRYGEVYSAVTALRQIGDPRAKPALETTKRQWESINHEDPQIVEECDKALKTIADKETGPVGGSHL